MWMQCFALLDLADLFCVYQGCTHLLYYFYLHSHINDLYISILNIVIFEYVTVTRFSKSPMLSI